ncbi:MAG: hypothetical protein L0220_32890, partial [Acidobacteria bacterium]|nr:hypothetical protein [Acidobacteriota bacterium]
KNYIQVSFYMARFLGTEEKARLFLNLLSQYGGVFVPERWGTDERAKNYFALGDYQALLNTWILPEKTKYLFFSRRKQAYVQMYFLIERHQYAKFNEFCLLIRDDYFRSQGNVDQLLRFSIDLCRMMQADYGFIAHAEQEQRQSPILTPAERLPGIYWSNFFGRPYIEFFGREKLLATPCYRSAEVDNDHIVLSMSTSPCDDEMIKSDDVVNRVKTYLNQNAFAGPKFPNEPCAVPTFDFTDVRGITMPASAESLRERVKNIRAELQSKGYQVFEQSRDQITFKGEDGAIVIIDMNTGNISLDTTGEFLSNVTNH